MVSGRIAVPWIVNVFQPRRPIEDNPIDCVGRHTWHVASLFGPTVVSTVRKANLLPLEFGVVGYFGPLDQVSDVLWIVALGFVMAASGNRLLVLFKLFWQRHLSHHHSTRHSADQLTAVQLYAGTYHPGVYWAAVFVFALHRAKAKLSSTAATAAATPTTGILVVHSLVFEFPIAGPYCFVAGSSKFLPLRLIGVQEAK